MRSSRCPHHVYHGVYNRDTQQIEFQDRCALLMRDFAAIPKPTSTRNRSKNLKNKSTAINSHKNAKNQNNSYKSTVLTDKQKQQIECHQVPFEKDFDYFSCPTYQQKFKSGISKNNAIPANDFQYSEQHSSGFGEMEFL